MIINKPCVCHIPPSLPSPLRTPQNSAVLFRLRVCCFVISFILIRIFSAVFSIHLFVEPRLRHIYSSSVSKLSIIHYHIRDYLLRSRAIFLMVMINPFPPKKHSLVEQPVLFEFRFSSLPAASIKVLYLPSGGQTTFYASNVRFCLRTQPNCIFFFGQSKSENIIERYPVSGKQLSAAGPLSMNKRGEIGSNTDANATDGYGC